MKPTNRASKLKSTSQGLDLHVRIGIKIQELSINEVTYIFFYPVALLIVWIGAWLINQSLRTTFHWPALADCCFWILMKFVIWVLPSLVLIRRVERRSVFAFLQLGNARRGLTWGGVAGLAVIAPNICVTSFSSGDRFRVPAFTLALVNAVLISPVVEELVLRGFLLGGLALKGVPFWIANSVATVTFVLAHLPGWFFQRRLFPIGQLFATIAFLTMLGFLFGWLKCRSGSLFAALVPHALNNTYFAVVTHL